MKKLAFCLAFLLCLVPCLSGCPRRNTFSQTFFLMDTMITVTLYTEDGDRATEIFDECEDLLSELDQLWSRHKDGSEATDFNASKGEPISIDPRTKLLIERALEVSQRTDGAFDITVAPLTDLWKICGERGSLPTTEELSSALTSCGYEKLFWKDDQLCKADPNVKIDLGGIGKGGAIGYLMDYLNTCDVMGGLVSFGSNVAVFGKKPDGDPFRIALRDPKDAAKSVGTLLLPAGQILSVSGDYERFVTIDGKNYHHILDPKTGYPTASGLSGVAVICEDGALADALSTALLCMGRESAMAFYESGVYDFEAVLISSEGEITTTKGMDGIFVKN